MEEEPEFGKFVHRAPRQRFLDADARGITPDSAFCLPHRLHRGAVGVIGSRQSVSTKMRTDPPAVRTYSIFPLDSQL
jgi:hypothetical protein